MIKTRIFRLIRDKRLSVPILRGFHHEFSKPEPQKNGKIDVKEQSFVAGGVQNKYKVFRDEEAMEIFDVEEARYQEQELPLDAEEDQYMGLNLKSKSAVKLDYILLIPIPFKEVFAAFSMLRIWLSCCARRM